MKTSPFARSHGATPPAAPAPVSACTNCGTAKRVDEVSVRAISQCCLQLSQLSHSCHIIVTIVTIVNVAHAPAGGSSTLPAPAPKHWTLHNFPLSMLIR